MALKIISTKLQQFAVIVTPDYQFRVWKGGYIEMWQDGIASWGHFPEYKFDDAEVDAILAAGLEVMK